MQLVSKVNQSNCNAVEAISVVSLLVLFATSLVAAIAMPLQLSIVIVFLFGGLHNLFELRYFLSRLPARFGKVGPFFKQAFGGVILLTCSYIVLGFLSGFGLWRTDFGGMWAATAYKLWNTAFLFWVLVLILTRAKEKPNRNWDLVFPVTFFLVGLNWLFGSLASIALVYIHPLIAFAVLYLEVKRSRPQLLPICRYVIASIPIFLLVLYVVLSRCDDLLLDSSLSIQLTKHAGSHVLPWLSTHLLLSTHVFLELLHYIVWLLLIPFVAFTSKQFELGNFKVENLNLKKLRLTRIPLTLRSIFFRKFVVAILCLACLVVVALQVSFSLDFATTRNVYFTIAIVHVLAEFPFLLRLI